MSLDQDLEKELAEGNGIDQAMALAPLPSEELPKSTTPVSLDIPSFGGSPFRPPSKPLPPTPRAMSAEFLTIPSPTRPPPIKPLTPLPTNIPENPDTAGGQTSPKPPTLKFSSSTNRPSWTSIVSKRPVKYGQGKHSGVELVPQPSDDPNDPLNWALWRKELNFGSLLVVVGMTGVMKTIFMTVNAQLVETYQVSYTAVTALTGVPMILSAFTGFVCLAASRVCGKRPLYLASLFLLLIGVVWNTSVASSYAQCMSARVVQGLGWGAFDTLVLGSIQDTYFEHERGLRIAIYSIVAVTTTWGAPLIGGVVSQSHAGVSLQFIILSAFFVVAIPAITLGAPETAFDRTSAFAPISTGSELNMIPPQSPGRRISLDTITKYLGKLKPYTYSGPTDLATLLQAPRALITPTTGLLALVSLLPYATLWGLTSSLPFLSPSSSSSTLGTLLTGPLLLSTATVLATTLTPLLPLPTKLTFKLTPKHIITLHPPKKCHIPTTLITTSLLPLASLLPLTLLHSQQPYSPILTSAFLGILALAAYLLAATAGPLIAASTAFTAPNITVAARSAVDMSGGVACWRAVGAGVFILAVPRILLQGQAAEGGMGSGLWGLCIGVAAAQVVVGVVVGGLWWICGEGAVKRGDGRVMGLVRVGGGGDLLRRSGSFFDLD